MKSSFEFEKVNESFIWKCECISSLSSPWPISTWYVLLCYIPPLSSVWACSRMQVVLWESCPNILHTFPELVRASRCLLLGKSIFDIGPNVFDNVDVRRVDWPLENSELLLGKPLLYNVCCMHSRIVLLKDRFRGIHAEPIE